MATYVLCIINILASFDVCFVLYHAALCIYMYVAFSLICPIQCNVVYVFLVFQLHLHQLFKKKRMKLIPFLEVVRLVATVCSTVFPSIISVCLLASIEVEQLLSTDRMDCCCSCLKREINNCHD